MKHLKTTTPSSAIYFWSTSILSTIGEKHSLLLIYYHHDESLLITLDKVENVKYIGQVVQYGSNIHGGLGKKSILNGKVLILSTIYSFLNWNMQISQPHKSLKAFSRSTKKRRKLLLKISTPMWCRSPMENLDWWKSSIWLRSKLFRLHFAMVFSYTTTWSTHGIHSVRKSRCFSQTDYFLFIFLLPLCLLIRILT